MEAIGPNPGPSASGNDIYTGHKSGVMASASMPRTCSLERSRPSAEDDFNALKGDFYHGSYARASHDRAMHAQYHSSLPTDEPSTASRSDLSFTDLSNLPEWQRDLVDLEAACMPWQGPRRYRFLGLPKISFFRSKVEIKARNPANCQVIDYNVPRKNKLLNFVCRIFGFLVFCFLFASFHQQLGISCATLSTTSDQSSEMGRSLLFLWAETLVTTGACFLIAQGYFGMRAARERMERVRQTAVTLAYSFLKTTSADMGGGHDKDALQVLIYECLALLTAFPVALIHQVQGNTCEPAVTKYCQEVAQRLRRLRNGEARIGWSQYNAGRWDSFSHGHRHYTTVEYFFEIFSLQLEAEFSKQSMKTLVPSMAPQYIIYNLRNHFENIVDMGNLDDRRTPIMRENIDMLALAGRECSIFSKRDVTPVAVLWTIDICCRAIAFGTPVQHCDWLVNGTSEGFEIPSLEVLGSALVMSVLSATIMAVLSEMWTLWDPFGKGMNTFSWSLGIATEIDHMLNEFYEYDTKVLVRKHAYMDPSAQLNGMMNGGLCDCSSDRPQTV